ncbi:MAG: glycine--tRNA ligase [Patescibacteria group bacterium]
MSDHMEKIVALTKRRGFVYPGSDLYSGLAGTWDYGHLGVLLKNNIRDLWWRVFVLGRDDMLGLDSASLLKADVWRASGHLEHFADPLVECADCHHRFRADQLATDRCPDCGGALGSSRQFNLMFNTQVGAATAAGQTAYLRPETAQGIFINFKNLLDAYHLKLPFGVAQVGKAFRNEITPRDWLFRAREFEQMEIEYFVRPGTAEKEFETWRQSMLEFARALGLPADSVHELEVPDGERAHYSRRTTDFEFDFPFGRKELWGLADRGQYDLERHAAASHQELVYFDDQTKEKIVPEVIEPTFGLDRTVLAVLVAAYAEDRLGEGERTVLKFNYALAPIKAAVFPLLANKPDLVAKARQVYDELKKTVTPVMFDDNGNIGKRYRRQDEIGTPFCITIDFETLENNTVTVRQRDTGTQDRVDISALPKVIH